jgi:hypothetical protein
MRTHARVRTSSRKAAPEPSLVSSSSLSSRSPEARISSSLAICTAASHDGAVRKRSDSGRAGKHSGALRARCARRENGTSFSFLRTRRMRLSIAMSSLAASDIAQPGPAGSTLPRWPTDCSRASRQTEEVSQDFSEKLHFAKKQKAGVPLHAPSKMSAPVNRAVRTRGNAPTAAAAVPGVCEPGRTGMPALISPPRPAPSMRRALHAALRPWRRCCLRADG